MMPEDRAQLRGPRHSRFGPHLDQFHPRGLASLRWLFLVLATAPLFFGDALAGDPAAAPSTPAVPQALSAGGRNTVTLYPGDDAAATVLSHPKGTTYVLSPGLYAQFMVSPRDGDAFIGLPGAVLSGAHPVTGFQRDGAFHVAPFDQAPGQVHGACQAERRCDRPEDLFVDDVLQRHVMRASSVTPGAYFIDYDAKKIILGSDPAGHNVEISRTRHAFAGTAEHVHVRGLVIEKYAIPAQMGAVADSIRPRHWLIENCEIRFNHGAGISVGDYSRLMHNFIHHNGQIGISGGGQNIEIEHNEIADNNTAGFNVAWEAGGMKLVVSLHATLRNNHVHDNHGSGLWTDIDDVDTLYEGNRIENNDGPGIHHEISYAAIIRNNVLGGNGKTDHRWGWGAQLLIQNSQGVDAYGNRVTVPEGGNGIIIIEQNRGSGPLGPYLAQDNMVHDNDIALDGKLGMLGALLTDYGLSKAATANNHFDRNRYHVLVPNGRYWRWPGRAGQISLDDLRKTLGEERDGVIVGLPPSTRSRE